MSKAQGIAVDLIDYFDEQIDGDDPVIATQHFGNTIDITFESGDRVLVEVTNVPTVEERRQKKSFDERPH